MSEQEKESIAPSPGSPISINVTPGRSCLPVALGLSLLLNLGFVVLLLILGYHWLFGSESADVLPQSHHSGKKEAKSKVAILEFQGVILEGFLGHALQQIRSIEKDESIKAIVLRVNSPGGTITGSEKLYRRLIQMRDGTNRHSKQKRTLIVSMASLAASGGYYISAPAKKIFADETTITGSIGVFASFPNVEELAKKAGFRMEIFQRGAVKTGGSPFRTMTANERAVWEDLIDESYQRFLKVIETGRPQLLGRLQDIVIDQTRLKGPPEEGFSILARSLSLIGSRNPWGMLTTLSAAKMPETFRYIRRRADGGIFTARQALKLGLVDEIGTLDDAIREAASLAGLGENYQVIRFQKPQSLVDSLLGLQASQFSLQQLQQGVTPRVWYLAPQSELAGLIAAMRERQ